MSERVANILRGLVGPEPLDPGSLHEDDLKCLLGHMLRSEKREYRAHAMQVLVKVHGIESAEMLAQLLHDRQCDPALRAVAAMHLARIGSPHAERMLVAALELSTDPGLTIRIAHALGMIGGPLSVDALRAHIQKGEFLVREQISFSLSIIACRTGIPCFEPAVPTEEHLLRPDPEQAWPVIVETIPASEIGALVTSSVDTYGEKVSSEYGYRIRCGEKEMALIFNERLTHAESSTRATRLAQIVGFMLQRSPGSGSYSTGSLLISWPHSSSCANLALFRTSGRQLMFGQALIQGQGADFELVTVCGAGGLPAMLKGRFEGRRVMISEAVSVRTRAALTSRHRREPEQSSGLPELGPNLTKFRNSAE